MKAEKLETPIIRANWPRCVHSVRLSASPTITRLIRERRAEARGIKPEQCGEYATHRIDGEPYCRVHAGNLALAHMLAETK